MSGRKHRARRRRPELSQHFLRDLSASRLVHATSIQPSDLVIEIGAGRGALTRYLIKHAASVVAVEVDPCLVEKLRQNYGEKAKVVETDFLTMELPSQAYSVIGNIPYAKSTEIVRKLSGASNPPRDVWLVVQRELANRMCGHPYGKETLWSLRLKPHWHVEIIARLKRNDFSPPPSVDSVFMQMSHRGRPILHTRQYQRYMDLIETVFRSNSTILRVLRPKLGKLQIRRLASELRFSLDNMPSDLTFEQWLGIFRQWDTS